MNRSAGNPLISIIIPLLEINDYVRESIPQILELDYDNFEIILLPDKNTSETFPKTRIIPSITSNPSLKRNLGVKNARGEIVAFLDDDAYPKASWLKNSLKNFHAKDVVAVGGPAITPQSDSVLQKASAAVSETFIGGGKVRNRFIPIGKVQEIDDWPSVNLLVRRDIFVKTGGFDTKYWPGEDTKLCLELLKFGKILYAPNVQVYHHRRASLVKHLRQNGNYGLHRGHFAKKYPKNSLKFFYLVPSFFSIYLLIGILLLLIPYTLSLTPYYFIPLLLYFVIMFWELIFVSIRYKNPLVGIAAIPYIIGTHFYYGLRFIKGYFSSDISSATHSKKSQ